MIRARNGTPTPRPWTVTEWDYPDQGKSWGSGWVIYPEVIDGFGVIAVAFDRGPDLDQDDSLANANLIVHAVNLHDDLLAALTDLLACHRVRECNVLIDGRGCAHVVRARSLLRAAKT